MRRRALLAAIPPTISAAVAGCIGDASSNDVSRAMEEYESDTEGKEFDQRSRQQSFCDDGFVVIENGICSEDEQVLILGEESDGYRSAISLFGFVLPSETDAEALKLDHLNEAELALTEDADYDDESLLIVQGRYPQSRATLEVQNVGVGSEQTYVGTKSLMQDDDEPELVSTLVRVAAQGLSETVVVGNELVDNGDDPVGYAIFE